MGERAIPIHPEFAHEIQRDHEKRSEIEKCAKSFLHFLNYWHHIDSRTGQSIILGDDLWSGQMEFIKEMDLHPIIYVLKARKLGFSTIAIAYCAWHQRFGPDNARVHAFSRREDAAVDILDGVKHGLRRLPPWMKLPVERTTQREYMVRGSPNDHRLTKVYPSNPDTAVEATCTHAMIDEFARMPDNRLVYQALEPTLAGTVHLLTTGQGPEDFSATLWRQARAGDNDFFPLFVDALHRPDRNEAWLEAQKRKNPEEHVKREYPMTEQDALFGSGLYKFKETDINWCGGGSGPRKHNPTHRYVKSWDIGRHQDAAVGMVVDVSVSPMEVVHYIRMRECTYPEIQNEIEKVHRMYPGINQPTVIEQNNAGEAVAENLDLLPDKDWVLFKTTGRSKPKMIEGLQVAVEQKDIRWSASQWPQLDSEMRQYQVPDDNVVQDSVMALGIAVASEGLPYSRGKIGKVMTW